MSNIALFFGSFNPIHIGHLSLAMETLRLTNSDEVWFIVSPQSPFKIGDKLIDAWHRIEMVKIAIAENKNLKVSDIELKRNETSYTADTLKELCEEYPTHRFSILMGEDNLEGLDQWKEANYIKSNYSILVYPRMSNKKLKIPSNANIKYFDASFIDISATEIRNSIINNNPLLKFLPTGVYEYIKNNNLL